MHRDKRLVQMIETDQSPVPTIESIRDDWVGGPDRRAMSLAIVESQMS